MKFMGILDIQVALKAVERNGDALQYVLSKEFFISIAEKFNIKIEF